MTFQEASNELMGFVPKLSILFAQKCVNRAWRKVRDERPWSFLLQEAVINSPGIITSGSFTVTQNSNQVTADATASAAITGLANPILTLRQFRAVAGPIYNIIAADFSVPAAVVLTLDRLYSEPSGAALTYQIYEAYYPMPADFLRPVSVFDPINGYPLKLHRTKPWLDRRDPQRTSQGQPYYMVSYKTGKVGSNLNVYFYELWPQPTFQNGFLMLYQQRGADFSAPQDVFPSQISDDTVTLGARYYAYEWAESMKGVHAELQATDWITLRREIARDFKEQLYGDVKQDEEAFVQMVANFQSRILSLGPIDAAFMQTHASLWG